MRKPILSNLAFLLLFSITVAAQIPKTMSYQGVLSDTSGNAVADGNYNLTFRIYDVASGGTEIWTETQTIAVADGIFNAILGSATPLNLVFNQPYWLGVSVDGGTELSPRIELTSAPYSLEPDSGSGGSGDGHSLDAADGDPVDAVYVDNDGKVGIGITNPGYQMDIRGDNPDDGVLIQVGNSDASHALRFFGGRLNDPNPFIQWKAGDPLRFSTDANGFTELMRINSNGMVGIGTNPGEKLHVAGNARFNLGNGNLNLTTPGGWPGIIAYTPAGHRREIIFDDQMAGGGGIRLLTSSSSAPSAADNGIVINESGKVGIGIPNPDSDAKLHVASHDLYAGYFTSDSLSQLTHVIHAEYNGPSATFPSDVIGVYGESVQAPSYGVGAYFKGGWVGVVGSATESGGGSRFGVRAQADGGSSNNSTIFGVSGTAIGGATTYGVYGVGGSGSSNNYAVYADGNLAYTGNLINASDAKLKDNIRPLTGSLNKLMQLTPRSFRFINERQYAHMNLPSGEHYGLIAQEVEQVLPELVSNNSHPSAAVIRGEKSEDPPIAYKGLNYMELIPLLIDAIKEQQQEIESLKAEVRSLKTR